MAWVRVQQAERSMFHKLLLPLGRAPLAPLMPRRVGGRAGGAEHKSPSWLCSLVFGSPFVRVERL